MGGGGVNVLNWGAIQEVEVSFYDNPKRTRGSDEI